jgi:hypothetical protein
MTYSIPEHLKKALQYADLTVAEVMDIKALKRGDADPARQRRAWNTIVQKICKVEDLEFIIGGEDGRRISDLNAGRRMVGLNLEKIANLPIEVQKTIDDPKETMSMSNSKGE